jgi:hypothetical protein
MFPSGESNQDRILGIGNIQDFFFAFKKSHATGLSITDINNLDLRHHNRPGVAYEKTATAADKPRGIAGGCYH